MENNIILELFKKIESEDSRKTFLIYTFGTIGIFCSLFFTIDGYNQNRSYFYIISLFLLFSITTVNLIYLYNKGNTRITANILIFTFFVFCIVLFAFIGVDHTAIVWYFVFSPLAILLTDIKKGLIYNVLLFIITIFFIINPLDFAVNTYPKALILRFLIAYPSVNAFILIFEYTRNRSYQAYMDTLKKVKHKNDELLIAKEELTKLNQTKDKFFSIIAHDLRSPFNSIMALSTMLSEDNQLSEKERREFVSHITESSKAAKNLLDNLFTWALSQSGQVEFSPQILDVKAIVDEVFLIAEGAAKGKDIVLINEVTSNNSVHADANMLQTIVRNLIFNSIKFTHRKGKITVSTLSSHENGFIKISVTDSGVGMDQNQVDDLFRLNNNSSSAGTENEQGTGLGLVICKEFIEKHKGEIYVESAVGKGSSFVFSIPTG